jgi:hypothetical protein
MQSATQSPAQSPAEMSQSKPWQYRRGQSGNPAGSLSRAAKLARRDALIAEWTRDIGGEGALSAVELDLVRKAAELMMLRSSKAEDAVRVANSVSKILAQVGLVDRRGKKREPEHVPLRERLGGGA